MKVKPITAARMYGITMSYTDRTAKKHLTPGAYPTEDYRPAYEKAAEVANILRARLPEGSFWRADEHFHHRTWGVVLAIPDSEVNFFINEGLDRLRDELDARVTGIMIQPRSTASGYYWIDKECPECRPMKISQIEPRDLEHPE